MNFLEELSSEWYEYQGYFVKKNIRVDKLDKGGYKGEFDVVAYNPYTHELIHIETSGASTSIRNTVEKFNKKFKYTQDDYIRILKFKEIKTIKKIAIAGYSKTTSAKLDGIELITIPRFVQNISVEIDKINFMKIILPEKFPLLRAIQLARQVCVQV